MQVRRSPHQHFFASYGPSTSVWSVIFNDTGVSCLFPLISSLKCILLHPSLFYKELEKCQIFFIKNTQ